MKEDIYIKIFKYASDKIDGVTIDEVIDYLNIPKDDQRRNFVMRIINRYMDRAEGYGEKFIMKGEASNLLNQHQGLVATKRAFWVVVSALGVSLAALTITYWGIKSDIGSDEMWKNNQISKLEEMVIELKTVNQELKGSFEKLNTEIDNLNLKPKVEK